jgi:hypothetical protein
LDVTTHAQLQTQREEIFGRLNAAPDIARLMLINPVKALSDVGVHLSPSVASHVLHVLQLPASAQERRKTLERSLRDRLGEPPEPLDSAWLARVVFEKLALKPKRTRGREPVFAPPVNQADLERLQRRRPTIRPAPELPRPPGGTTISVAPWRPAFRRLDLDAPVPEVPAARTAPKRLPLVDLWFYKDDSPVAHDLLELGVILRGAFPIHSTHGYREIKAGRRKSAFLAWITDVRFPQR